MTKTIRKSNDILRFALQSKMVLWLSETNKYIVTEITAGEVVRQLLNKKELNQIIEYCEVEFDFSREQATKFVSEIKSYLSDLLKDSNQSRTELFGSSLFEKGDVQFFSKRYYSINEIIFFVEYETTQAEYLIHPKFAHLEVPSAADFDHHFRLYNSTGNYSLCLDSGERRAWTEENSHYLVGKFSMEILQKIYKLEEDDWMGVFHAAGITDGNNCLMFLGDSGNGKSTLSAILMANGLDVLADDYLPVQSESGLVCRFPAALSIKKNAFDFVSKQFPEILHSKEYFNPALDKTFRYLAPKRPENLGVPCKALVFVKYENNAGFKLEEMPKVEAFKQLVPDSWISPRPENARRFMQWFNGLPCFQLTYSDNDMMVQNVKNLLSDELS